VSTLSAVVDPEYALTWPKALFEWEAQRVIGVSDERVASSISHLLVEAYHDRDVAIRFRDDTGASFGAYASGTVPMAARAWLFTLLEDKARLRPYVPPRYWAERNGHVTAALASPSHALPDDVVSLIDRLQDQGYFPNLMPRECPDSPTDYDWVAQSIKEATHMEVRWPPPEADVDLMKELMTFTLIEFFHDHAQRPRWASIHDYAECGPHYHDPDRAAGGAVYRWRTNELLERHDVPLRLGNKGVERGRLVRHFGAGLDALAEAQVADGAAAPTATAEAVRMYRERDASLPQKRSALNLLAGELERRRQAVKALLKKDEAALFDIANNYAIRHQRDGQREDYGLDYLDWIFWNFLATVDLMNRVQAPDTGTGASRPGERTP
jgi:hypothetical protein